MLTTTDKHWGQVCKDSMVGWGEERAPGYISIFYRNDKYFRNNLREFIVLV